MRRLALFLTALTLSACSTFDEQKTDIGFDSNNWRAKGKFSYKSEETTESGNFDWRQTGDEYQLRLYGPLGIGTVRVSGNPNLVRIQNRDQDISSDQPLSLMYRLTGLEIPLNSLPKWILGKPAGQAPKNLSRDSNQRALVFEERGWELSYSEYDSLDSNDIPGNIEARKDSIQLRLIVRSFEFQ